MTARYELAPIIAGVLAIAAATIFLGYPLAHVVINAVTPHGQDPALGNLTVRNFERFFISASYQRALWNSVVSSGGATLLAAAFAVPMAYTVARVDIAWRPLILALSVVPLIAPPFIGAYAWIMLLGNNGMITQTILSIFGWRLPSIYGAFGVIVALALSYFPYIFLIVQGALAATDPAIEEAASMAGASRARVLRTITIPMIAPAIGAGMMLVFIKALGDFGVPSILGGEYQVLPTLIYYQIHGFFNLNTGSAIAIVNLLLTILALAILSAISRRQVATLSGTARATRLTSPAARLAGNTYIWLVLILSLLPQAMVLLYSFAERWGDTLLPSVYGFDNYRRVFGEALATTWNTVLLSGAATIACLAFGTITAYATVRGKAVARWALDLTIMLPFVLPGLVVGVAYLSAFNDPPIVLTGTAAILVFAYFTRRVAFIFRSAAAAIGQVDNKLEEASSICGATWGATMRRVMVPLIGPALIAGGVLVFATLIGEISATVLLYSAQWKTISIAIYELVNANDLAKASALGTLCNALTLFLVLLASGLLGRNMSEMFR
ncbi:MAG: iron ABC transporter permease [Alphaproteobacteria bacterium]|nr:iron ABC transporter permease [Alphaproteobacteria bacterium]